jgi:hypothetical protein
MPWASLIHGADVVLSQNSIDAKTECFFARHDARMSAEVARGLRQIRLNLRVVDVAKSFGINGEPGGNRTHNPQIKRRRQIEADHSRPRKIGVCCPSPQSSEAVFGAVSRLGLQVLARSRAGVVLAQSAHQSSGLFCCPDDPRKLSRPPRTRPAIERRGQAQRKSEDIDHTGVAASSVITVLPDIE